MHYFFNSIYLFFIKTILRRIFFGFSVLVFVFVGVPLLDVLPIRNDLSQWILLIFAGLCGMSYIRKLRFSNLMLLYVGFANGTLFGALFGLAAMFPPEYTTALMSGNGLAGVIIFALRSITKVSYEGKDPNGGRKSSILYFSMTCVVLFICLVGVFAIRILPFSKYYMSLYSKKSPEKESLINSTPSSSNVRYRDVLKKIWVQGINALFCFFVSLSLFPGLTYKIPPSTPKLGNGWIGILLVGMFQIFDLVGRTAPKWTLFISPKWLWPCNLARSIFFILFPLCIIPLGDPYIKSNVWAIIFMIIFSLTNGYFGTLAMVYGPMEVEEHERQVAGNLMSLFLQTGIFLGVNFALFMLFCVDPEALYKMFT